MKTCDHDEKHFHAGVGCTVCMMQRRMIETARAFLRDQGDRLCPNCIERVTRHLPPLDEKPKT